MSAWVKVGAKCVCVDDIWSAGAWYGIETLPKRGVEYTIRNLVTYEGVLCCRLVEVVNAPLDYQQGIIEAAFSIARFRPVTPRTQEQDVALIKSLLQPAVHDALALVWRDQ